MVAFTSHLRDHELFWQSWSLDQWLGKRPLLVEHFDGDHHGSSSSPRAVKAFVGGMLAMTTTSKLPRALSRAVSLSTSHQGLRGRNPCKVLHYLPLGVIRPRMGFKTS
uniref:Uncharacterized protein n=1 Tax=Solanum tuberosum TaxID=4113 RepID=M1DWL9_SOLTU